MISPLLKFTLLLAGVLEIAVPLTLILWGRRAFKVGLGPFLVGSTMFILSLFRLPINAVFQHMLLTTQVGLALRPLTLHLSHLSLHLLPLFSSAMASLFEEGVRLLAFTRILRVGGWRIGVAYGVGHGGMESILVAGVNSLVVALLLVFSPHLLPSHLLTLLDGLSPHLPFLGLYERMMAIVIQVALSLLVLRSVREGKPLYLAAAFLIHFSVNLAALTLANLLGVLWVEVALTPIALASYLYIARARRAEGDCIQRLVRRGRRPPARRCAS